MSCNYCQKRRSQHSTHYNISNVRERIIPTYCHTQIFQGKQNDVHVRCTPTFHSKAFEVQGYQPRVNQNIRPKCHQKKEEKVVYQNNTHSQRQDALNPLSCGLGCQNVQWFDPAKQKLFDSLGGCTSNYSKERKMADLSSNPVFGGNTMIPLDCHNCECECVQTQVQPAKCEQVQTQCQLPKPEVCPAPENNVVKEEAIVQEEESIRKNSENSDSLDQDKQKPQPKIQPKPQPKQIAQPTKKPQSKKSLPPQKYALKNDVTLCTRGCSAGRKIAKTMVLGEDKPAYTVFRR